MVYEVPIQRVLEPLNLSEEDNFDGAHAVICNPPYNTSQIEYLSSSEHDRLRWYNMSHFVQSHSILMDLGADWHKFCSVL